MTMSSGSVISETSEESCVLSTKESCMSTSSSTNVKFSTSKSLSSLNKGKIDGPNAIGSNVPMLDDELNVDSEGVSVERIRYR